MQQIVINGDNLEVLKKYPDNYFDAVVTDPPYGLGKEPDAVELMKDWVDHGYHEIKGAGFMGKEWDAFVPQPLFWKEVFRVLKHGGHVVSFFGTRTYDWGVMAMRFAGFEVRDCIQWLYGSGFPKSYNVAKGIEGKIVNGSSSWNDWKNLDGEKEQVNWGYSKWQAEQGYRADCTEANKKRVGKVNFQSEEAKQWDGWGSALKPANEPIVLARKPLEKGLSIAENVLKWGTGGINIDGCRVGYNEYDKTEYITNRVGYKLGFDHKQIEGDDKSNSYKIHKNNFGKEHQVFNQKGRFPANIILTHHPQCECKQNEEVEDWNCHPDCPIKILDEQSGNVGGDTRESKPTYDKSIWGNAKSIESKSLYNDKGGASRFFYCAKASKSERNKGLDGFEEKRSSAYGYEIGLGEKGEGMFKDRNPIKQNFHPTVKPVKLMQYLARLITPLNGKVLDPFCGSGTTGIACKLEGFEFVGIEQDPEYTKIAQARITNWKEEKEEHKPEIKKNEPPPLTQTTLF